MTVLTQQHPMASNHAFADTGHAQILHPKENYGKVVFAIRKGGRFSQNVVALNDLEYATRHYDNVDDIYLTQNRFGWCRRTSQLSQLNACWVDLDYYDTEFEGHTPEAIYSGCVNILQERGLPLPTFAMSTGRGVLLVWQLIPIPPQALPRWQHVQRELTRMFKCYGGDTNARDAARMFRLSGSRNSKSGNVVRPLTDLGVLYNFDSFAEEVGPFTREELRLKKEERKLKKKAQRDSLGMSSNLIGSAELWQGRIRDLDKLVQHIWFGGIPSGQRDSFLFVYASGLSWLADNDPLKRDIVSHAAEITGGVWTERETLSNMSSVLKRSEQSAKGQKISYAGKRIDPRYKMSNEAIIELLGVTENDLQEAGCTSILTKDQMKDRDRKQQLARRRKGGAKPRIVYETNSKAKTRPWDDLGISERTYYRRRLHEQANKTPTLIGGRGVKPCIVGISLVLSEGQPVDSTANSKAALTQAAPVSPVGMPKANSQIKAVAKPERHCVQRQQNLPNDQLQLSMFDSFFDDTAFKKQQHDLEKAPDTLKVWRSNNNLTQLQAARKFSVTRSTLSNWENGQFLPSIASLGLISDVTGVPLGSR